MEAEQIESRIAKMMSRQRFSHSIGVRKRQLPWLKGTERTYKGRTCRPCP